LATYFPATSANRDSGHDSDTSSAPLRRSSAKERIETIGARTISVLAMFP
jgi:hypothetical protein